MAEQIPRCISQADFDSWKASHIRAYDHSTLCADCLPEWRAKKVVLDQCDSDVWEQINFSSREMKKAQGAANDK